MILIRRIVEFRDQLAILLFGGIDDKDVDAANESGRDHLSPFGFVTVHTWSARAERRQVVLPVSFLKHMLNLVGAEDRTILYVFDTIEVDVQRNDVPFKRLIFANVDVIAHHRAMLTAATQAESHGRIGTDAREIHSAVPRAGDPVEASIQGLVEHNAYVTISPGANKAHEQEGQNTGDCNLVENFSCHQSSREEPPSDKRDSAHNKNPLE